MNAHKQAPVSVYIAAVLTAAAAVVLDIVARQHFVHTATLAMVAVVVGVLRVRMAGGWHGAFAMVSGAVVAQPAVRAATILFPESGRLSHESLTLTHVVFAAVVVVAVTGAQALLTSLSAIRPIARLLAGLSRVIDTPYLQLLRSPTEFAPVTRDPFAAAVSRRGPPIRVACTP